MLWSIVVVVSGSVVAPDSRRRSMSSNHASRSLASKPSAPSSVQPILPCWFSHVANQAMYPPGSLRAATSPSVAARIFSPASMRSSHEKSPDGSVAPASSHTVGL